MGEGGGGRGSQSASRNPSYTDLIASCSPTKLRLASPARTHEQNETIYLLDSPPPNLQSVKGIVRNDRGRVLVGWGTTAVASWLVGEKRRDKREADRLQAAMPDPPDLRADALGVREPPPCLVR